MKASDKPEVRFEEPVKRRPQSSLLSDLGDRLARTFSVSERMQSPTQLNGGSEGPDTDERPSRSGPPTAPRFAIVRQGYECAAVEEYVAELEQELIDLDRELADLQARAPSGNKVAAELERIGEQTAAILLAAHDQAQETTRRAQAEADRCIADAASNAIAITEDANRQLRQLETDKTSLRGERARLLEDIRMLATALSSLADDASERFPSEPGITAPKAAGETPGDS